MNTKEYTVRPIDDFETVLYRGDLYGAARYHFQWMDKEDVIIDEDGYIVPQSEWLEHYTSRIINSWRGIRNKEEDDRMIKQVFVIMSVKDPEGFTVEYPCLLNKNYPIKNDFESLIDAVVNVHGLNKDSLNVQDITFYSDFPSVRMEVNK